MNVSFIAIPQSLQSLGLLDKPRRPAEPTPPPRGNLEGRQPPPEPSPATITYSASGRTNVARSTFMALLKSEWVMRRGG